MKKLLDIEFEKAVRLLVKYFPVSQENSRKPILFHDIRVGVYLYGENYPRDVVLAGVLHDALEFSEIGEQLLRNEFGDNVAELVRANTKDRSIEASGERIEELAKRCAENGRDALIIRAADTLDSFKHYTKTKNLPELDYCRKNAQAIFKYMPEEFEDSVFNELKNLLHTELRN